MPAWLLTHQEAHQWQEISEYPPSPSAHLHSSYSCVYIKALDLPRGDTQLTSNTAKTSEHLSAKEKKGKLIIMISCSTTCTVLVVVLSLLATAQTFRVFRGDEEPAIEELQIRNFSQLLPLAARTGERVTVEMTEGSQTMITQHGVNILLDCGALVPTTGRPAEGGVTWEIQRFQRDEFGLFFVPRPSFRVIPGMVKRIMTQGPLNSVLNITSSNAIQGGQDADNAVYTCTACTTDGCNSASMTMYLIGNMFRLVEGGEHVGLLI